MANESDSNYGEFCRVSKYNVRYSKFICIFPQTVKDTSPQ